MSTFLTPPVWYNSAGVKSESLNNIEYNNSAVSNTSYGKSAQSGIDGSNVNGAISIGDRAISSYDYSISIGSYANNSVKRGAMTGGIGAISIGAGSYAVNNISIGYNSEAAAYGSMAIGYGANVKNVPGNENGIAIGYNVISTGGGIGIGGSADANQIQLGNPNLRYDLKIGNNIGTINGINLFRAFASDGQTVQSANSAKMVKSVKEDANSSMSAMTITKLLPGAIYVVAVRFLNTNRDIHSSFILVNTANSSGTICFGSGCPILDASASVCARYVSQTPDSSGAKGNIDIVQISDSAFSTYPKATIKSICAFRIN